MWAWLMWMACTGGSAVPGPGATDETAGSEPSTFVPPGETGESEPLDSDSSPETGGAGETAETGGADSGLGSGWRSELYPEDWSLGYSVKDAFLHDFSYAGYHNGEVPLPSKLPGPVQDVLDWGADPTGALDSTEALQQAIDSTEDAGGGTVWIPAGLYRLDGYLAVGSSGVVIAGEGASSQLAFTDHASSDGRAHLSFSGHRVEEARHALSSDAEALSSTIVLESVEGLEVGQDVSLGWTITEEFVADHGMSGTWEISLDEFREMFRRNLVAVDPGSSTVELDVPLRYAALVRDGASLVRESGLIRECGLQDVALSTAVDWDDAWSHDRSHAVAMVEVKDCWMRGITTFPSPYPKDGRDLHLASNGLLVQESKRVSIADSDLGFAQNRGGGGNGYLYELMQSSEVLIRDSIGRAGRHNFIQNWDFGTSGCVWLRTHSEDGEALLESWLSVGTRGYSEYHHSLAMANLVDSSTTDDGWKAANRGDYSSGAGHAATQSVFWNTGGEGYLKSYQYGLGYIIGTSESLHVDTTVWDILDSAGTAPEDWLEGEGEGASLVPASLYEDQLSRRLGG